MIESVLITGANGGLGKECARQLALQDGVEKIYLACRNEERARAAKQSLEESTGRSIFEIVIVDVSNMESVRAAVESLSDPVDALVMNAGGMGGRDARQKTADGVTNIFATNVLGHVVLLEELLNAEKLTQVALFSGSEGARGIPQLAMRRPKLKSGDVAEFESICDGSYFGIWFNRIGAYGAGKLVAALWMSSVARKAPHVRIVTVSPGGTGGTNILNLPEAIKSVIARLPLSPVLRFIEFLGLMHPVEAGAKRYVAGLNDETYESGVFYASKKFVLTGPVVDQGTIFEELNVEKFQDNAHEAIRKFIG